MKRAIKRYSDYDAGARAALSSASDLADHEGRVSLDTALLLRGLLNTSPGIAASLAGEGLDGAAIARLRPPGTLPEARGIDDAVRGVLSAAEAETLGAGRSVVTVIDLLIGIARSQTPVAAAIHQVGISPEWIRDRLRNL